MDKLRELQQEYLKNVMAKKNLATITALARAIDVWPSTFNKFIKNDAKSQTHLSASTLDKLHRFSGIIPPTTLQTKGYIIDEYVLAEVIKKVFEKEKIKDSAESLLTLEQKCELIAIMYNKEILKSNNRKKK